MKLATLLILACGLLIGRCARAELPPWIWHVEDYRVPLPQAHIDGYALVYERVNIHTGEVSMADKVSASPTYKTIAECSKAQMGRFERPEKGFVKIYFCHAVYKWPAGTAVL